MLSSVRLYWCTIQPLSSEIGLQAPASQPFGHASRFQASPVATQIAAVDPSHCFVPGVHDTAASVPEPAAPAVPVPEPAAPAVPAPAAPSPIAPPPLPPTAPSVVPLRLPPQPTSATTTAARSKIFIVMERGYRPASAGGQMPAR